jgi:hypothetical protein
MYKRVCFGILMLISALSLCSTRHVSAQGTCDTNVYFKFPDTIPSTGPWYMITAQKDQPKEPIVKQELEDLYSRGALTGNLSDYYVNFTASMSLFSGTASWNYAYTKQEWDRESKKWIEVPHCDPYSQTVYRSIKTMKVFLLPDPSTIQWLHDLVAKPTLRLAYPNNWLPVVATGGGALFDARYSNEHGLHFLLANDVESWWGLPGKLNQISYIAAILNSDDQATIHKKGIDMAIPLCDANEGTKKNYSDDSTYKFECEIENGNIGDRIQSVKITITGFAFDIPGKFYIGVSTEIDPASYFNTPEPNTSANKFLPTNIGDGSYSNTAFNVWITVSTPCWSGDSWGADNKCDDVH